MQDIRICFVGDSFVNGTGDPSCLGWCGRACGAAGWAGHELTYYNLGVRRDTSTDIAYRWRREVDYRLLGEYDGRVVFSFGVNDCSLEKGKLRVEFRDSCRNADQILREAKQHFPVLVVGPPPIADSKQNARIAHLSEAIAEICAGFKIPYLDVFQPLSQSQVWMEEAAASDGSHPGRYGYLEFSNLFQGWSAWLDWLGSENKL